MTGARRVEDGYVTYQAFQMLHKDLQAHIIREDSLALAGTGR